MVQSDDQSSSAPARGPDLPGSGIYIMMVQTANINKAIAMLRI